MLQHSSPQSHESSQATVMVTASGGNLAMRRVGRVHGVSPEWARERFYRHTGRDATVVCYQAVGDMGAGIYTRPLKGKHAWLQAQRLVNISRPDALTNEGVMDCMQQQGQLAKTPADDIYDRAGWSKAGARKDRAKARGVET